MQFSPQKIFLGALLVGSAFLLGACGTGGGYGEVDTDYYGPYYGGGVYYGHPWYHRDGGRAYVSRPPARAWHGGGGGHPAPHPGGGAPHPSAPAPHPSGGGGGGGRTTPQPHNQRG